MPRPNPSNPGENADDFQSLIGFFVHLHRIPRSTLSVERGASGFDRLYGHFPLEFQANIEFRIGRNSIIEFHTDRNSIPARNRRRVETGRELLPNGIGATTAVCGNEFQKIFAEREDGSNFSALVRNGQKRAAQRAALEHFFTAYKLLRGARNCADTHSRLRTPGFCQTAA
jgi:hypothetical protein